MVSVNSPAKITFVDAVASGLRNTTNFRGTASRPFFWYWILFLALVRCVTVTIDGFIYPEDLTAEIVLTGESSDFGTMLELLNTQLQHSLLSSTFAVELLLLPSTIAVTVRRLRDAGWKPWVAFVAFASNYVGLAVTFATTSQMFVLLAEAFGPTPGDSAQKLVGIALALVALVLVNIGTSIATFIGTLQRTATPASS